LYAKDVLVVREKHGTPNGHVHASVRWSTTIKGFEKALRSWRAARCIPGGNKIISGKAVYDDKYIDYVSKGSAEGTLPDVVLGAISDVEACHKRYWTVNRSLKRKREGLDDVQDNVIKRLKPGASISDITAECVTQLTGRRIWVPAMMGLVMGVNGVLNPESNRREWQVIVANQMQRAAF